MARYRWLLLSGGEYEAFYRSECPEHYKEHEGFWLTTVRTMIHDTENGKEADLPLGLAIDMLWPCHWNFIQNLQIVLEAIGGKLRSDNPFAACGRNIALLPIRDRMKMVSNTLRVFCDDVETREDVDTKLVAILGKQTKEKRWLAASLDKTVRLQLNPPLELREISSLSGPDWTKQ